jgi:predicted transcriptional regulator
MMRKHYGKVIREEVLGKIRAGKKVAEIAEEYGIVGKTVRNWLSRETGGKSSELLEMSRLRRENEALLELVGRLTLDSSLAEKKARRERQH